MVIPPPSSVCKGKIIVGKWSIGQKLLIVAVCLWRKFINQRGFWCKKSSFQCRGRIVAIAADCKSAARKGFVGSSPTSCTIPRWQRSIFYLLIEMQPIFPVLGVVKNRINIFYKAMIFLEGWLRSSHPLRSDSQVRFGGIPNQCR